MRRSTFTALALFAAGCGADKTLADVSECFVQTSGLVACVDQFIIDYAGGDHTTQGLLGELKELRAKDRDIENYCHVIAHSIGRWTYLQTNDIGESFRRCDETCQSGCMHGAVERLFFREAQQDGIQHLELDRLGPILPGICTPEALGNPIPSVVFQCLHGLGHALMFSFEYQLSVALQGCDLLPTPYEQSSCHGGVFMENIVVPDERKRNIKADDPLYPCDGVDPRYSPACYQMQTSVMIALGLNDEQIGQACLGAGDFKSSCFLSFGRDMSSYVRIGEIGRAVTACEVYSVGNEVSCMGGVVYSLVETTRSFAYHFCNQLKVENRPMCFQLANDYAAGTYAVTPEQLRADCAAFAGADEQVCLDAVRG